MENLDLAIRVIDVAAIREDEDALMTNSVHIYSLDDQLGSYEKYENKNQS